MFISAHSLISCAELSDGLLMSTSTSATTAALQGTGTGIGTGTGTGSSSSNNNGNNGVALSLEDFQFSSSQLLSLLDSTDDALQVLKSDLMDALNKEVKSLDEDSWMFEGPRSRINLISKPGDLFTRRTIQSSNQWNFALRK